MSHEIRTPLNAIVGFSNILATPGMELEDEEKEDMIATINKNSHWNHSRVREDENDVVSEGDHVFRFDGL